MMTIAELDKQLCEKYPKIFRDRHAPMTQTCMCWGPECGPGWGNILMALCSNIQHHIDHSIERHDSAVEYNKMRGEMLAGDMTKFDEKYSQYKNSNNDWVENRRLEILGKALEVPPIVPQVVADQVKEKFGGLRFYYHGGDDVIDGMVRMAESWAANTCETCGKPGRLRGRGWLYTACDEHTKEEDFGVEE